MSCSLSNVYTDDGTPVSVKTANHSPFILLYMFLCLIGIMRRYYIHLMNFGESIAADAHLFTNF